MKAKNTKRIKHKGFQTRAIHAGQKIDPATGVPGATIGVIKDGMLIYSKGYGIADLEHDV